MTTPRLIVRLSESWSRLRRQNSIVRTACPMWLASHPTTGSTTRLCWTGQATPISKSTSCTTTRTNLPLYPAVQAYFRNHQPPTLMVWGKAIASSRRLARIPTGAICRMWNCI